MTEPEPGACADPSCPVLHADPANPIHPPDYEPGGPMWDWQPHASAPPCRYCGHPVSTHNGPYCMAAPTRSTADNETGPATDQTAGKDPSNKAEEGKQ